MPVGRVSGIRSWKNGVYFQLHASGSNPLFPGAPPIDVHVGITASIVPARLDLSASLSGDGFPNAELMIQDVTGTRRMVFTFETSGGPDTGPLRLMGDSRRPMNAISTSFEIDDAGHFVGETLMCGSGIEVQ